MSRHTLKRIPKEVEHIFRVYENTSQLIKPSLDPTIRNFLSKSNSFYENFNQLKLRRRSNFSATSYNPNDFPPVLNEVLSSIFNEPLNLEHELPVTSRHIHIEYLMLPESTEPLVSQKNKRTKHFTDYQARILSIFASYFTPHDHVPKPSRLSFAWYRRLLRNTPIIFFLRQKHLLLGPASIGEQNLPLTTLQASINELRREKYSADRDMNKKTRNYHLTELSTPDLLGLAIRAELATLAEAELSSREFWRSLKPQRDKLLQRVRILQEPTILFKNRPLKASPSELSQRYPIFETMNKIRELDDVNDVASVFPFDIAYNSLHMLTIEASILRDNHTDLLNILEASLEFEVYAIRIAKSAVSETDFESSLNESSSATYDQLINQAKNSGKKTHGSLLRRLGEWGLVSVEENSPATAFYLFK